MACKNHERRVASNERSFGSRRRIQLRAKTIVSRWVVLFSILFSGVSCDVSAQVVPTQEARPSPSFFVGGSLLSNISAAQIPALDGSALCGTFTNGGNNAFGGFLGASFAVTQELSLAPEFDYDNLSTSFTINASQTNQMPQVLAPDGASYVNVDRTRTYAAMLSMAAIAAMMSYSPLAGIRISAGPFAGILLQHSFLETEHLVSPASAVYAENSLSTRTIDQGSLPDLHLLQFGIALRAGYEFSVEPNVDLSPSIGWMLPFTNISSGSLHLYPANASLAFVYHLATAQQPIPAPAAARPIANTPSPSIPEHAEIEVSIKALGVGENGEQVSEPVLSIERTHVTEVYPMLHYVFFNDGSASIPARYDLSTAQSRSSFNEKDLFKDDALEIHHHVLDIIGHRLAEDTSASITVVGARSEHSAGDSSIGTSISMARAQAVQDYLANVWSISRGRVHLRGRSLPEVPSDDHNAFGQAENRRVDIIPSTPAVTAPLWTEHIERVATPPRIDFVPAITTGSRVGIRSATITVMQHGHLLRQIDALTDSAVSQYRWTIDDRSMPDGPTGLEDSLTYLFRVVDSLGDTARASGVIHLREQASDISKYSRDTANEKQIQRYSLILFDYSSSQLDQTESERIVNAMATDIGGRTQITLTGHTDRTGDDAFNDDLSRARAMQAAEMLRAELSRMDKTATGITVEWRGGRDELFDNSIPEGRMLSRTVRATIENP